MSDSPRPLTEPREGWNTRVVLSCGCDLWLNVQSPSLGPALGDYYSCSLHSPVRDYDQQTGDANHERDQRAVEIARWVPA